jgi:hypothetical protein
MRPGGLAGCPAGLGFAASLVAVLAKDVKRTGTAGTDACRQSSLNSKLSLLDTLEGLSLLGRSEKTRSWKEWTMKAAPYFGSSVACVVTVVADGVVAIPISKSSEFT